MALVENLDRICRNRNRNILSERQAAIKAFSSLKTGLGLPQPTEHGRVQLIRVPGHDGNDCNKMADQLAELGSEQLFIGPEPT
jgi:ribonuclease HI